ncbi:DUF1016 N-terminal domain-containing protein [Sphingobacterium sp. CZ-2]|uniref:DUF1016 N-terminal domain-containing protein n=1 Tax=Sphingobacterium sp. CZ-2 TaxID=2557994 RepID=UPI00106FC48B|nr:DUF1016 N-terminal domain-containing protein [Sphingobacterium sp. CZ-2]QBR13358.1 DUF1016 family protein [Sphingobacterium sp. CZ-2]
MSSQSQKNINISEYREILHQAISHIYTAQTLIAKQVNSIANSAYWNLGKLLFEKQLEEGYGSGVVKQLSIDLKNKFPDMGLSPRNLWNMKRYYERYNQADTKLLQAVAVLPWGHNLLLLDKVQSLSAVAFYANEVATKGWSRDLLLNAIKMDSYSRADNHVKTNNFTNTLPGISAEYANEVFKSSYNLGFLGDKDHLDVEIALQDINKPIGVAEYQLLLPKDELQALILNEINSTEGDNEQR